MKILNKILPFILLLAFTFLLRINTFNFPYERDEGEYAYIAYYANQGVLPYRDVFDQKPPLIFLIFYLGEIINPGGNWGPRFLAAIFTFTSAVLIYFIGKKQFDKKVGMLAMWLFIAMLTIPAMTPFSANTEIFLLPFMVGSYLIFVNFRNTNKKIPWFMFGVLSSIAIMIKPICALFLLFIFLFWIYEQNIKIYNTRQLLVKFLLTFLGIIFVVGPIFIYLIYNNAMRSFFDTVVIYNVHYFREFQNEGLSPFTSFIGRLLITFPLVFLSILIYFLNYRQNLRLYIGVLFSLFLPVYNSPILHYYLIIIPFMALFASAGFLYLLGKYNIKRGISWSFLSFLIIIFTVSLNLKTILFSKNELFKKTYLPNPFLSSEGFAEIIKKYTALNDEVLMLGNEPQVLYYSKRRSASRFFYMYPVLIPTAESKAYQEEYINNLREKEPRYIVYSPYITSGIVVSSEIDSFFASINKIIMEKYEVLGGCTSDNDCGWTENVNLDNTNRYPFILLKKRV